MSIQATIAQIRSALVNTFTAIDTWFEQDATLRDYRPSSGGWTIGEILEHIGLTNHYLLILIDKAARKALQNTHNLALEAELQGYAFRWDKLAEVGLHKSFAWTRPEHMEPTGTKPLAEVRAQLQEQMNQCLAVLSHLPNGEGILYRTTMTVNDLGKLDVYEYIYFLVQHGQRHLTQMQHNEAAFRSART